MKVHLTPIFFFFSLKRIYMLFEMLLRKKIWIRLNPRFAVPRRNLKNSPKTPPFCFTTDFEENGSSGCCDVYLGRSNITRPLISFRMVQDTSEKCAEMPSKSAIGCYSNIPDLKKDILNNVLAMIGQWNNKDINDGWFCRTETSELSLWEPLKNSHWNLFRRLSNAIFKIFCLKPTSNLSKYYRQPTSSSPAVFIT